MAPRRLDDALARVAPPRRVPRARSARALDAAGLIVLLAAGVSIDAIVPWALLAIPMTALVVRLLADLEAHGPIAIGRLRDRAEADEPARGEPGSRVAGEAR